jgi:cytoplasmic iron level regulating protein YaaA (DUF328/UPF0246 family)
MRPAPENGKPLPYPLLLDEATELSNYLKTLTPRKLATAMRLSNKLATVTHNLIGSWNTNPLKQRSAVDSFLGDIYSGLQVAGWNKDDRVYADQSLRILSGLYGILRPSDGIYPYRLEMGYKLPNQKYANLYTYWGDEVAKQLPDTEPIVNLAAVEYSNLVNPYVDDTRVIAPRFLTVSPMTGEPTFVVVHAKIARGAFANWLIKSRVKDIQKLSDFNDLGYKYDLNLSSHNAPVFVCKEFGGLGLSVRLS